jgi:hypothetical protein
MFITWEQVVAEKDQYIGGEVRFIDNDHMYRGPVIDITHNNGIIMLVTEWLAIYDFGMGQWKYFGDQWSSITVNVAEHQPKKFGSNNNISFTLPKGNCDLYPAFCGHLTPDRVINFPS